MTRTLSKTFLAIFSMRTVLITPELRVSILQIISIVDTLYAETRSTDRNAILKAAHWAFASGRKRFEEKGNLQRPLQRFASTTIPSALK